MMCCPACGTPHKAARQHDAVVIVPSLPGCRASEEGVGRLWTRAVGALCYAISIVPLRLNRRGRAPGLVAGWELC